MQRHATTESVEFAVSQVGCAPRYLVTPRMREGNEAGIHADPPALPIPIGELFTPSKESSILSLATRRYNTMLDMEGSCYYHYVYSNYCIWDGG